MNILWKKIKCIEDLYDFFGEGIFLGRYDGRICVAQYNKEDKNIYACFNPAQCNPIKINNLHWNKFDYVCNVFALEIIEVDKELSCEYCDNEYNEYWCYPNQMNQPCEHLYCIKRSFYKPCQKDCKNYEE